MNIDFSFVLFVLTVISGVIALIDKYYVEKRRVGEAVSKQAKMASGSKVELNGKPPIIAEYARSLFIVFLVVFVLRAFIIEPFRIPSGSMLPNLKINDFILVNKYAYGVKLPVINKEVISIGEPKRGDVIVFKYPVNPGVDFIKRVIGVPGDHISYENKVLTVNGKVVPHLFQKDIIEPANSQYNISKEYREDLDDVTYDVLTMPTRPVQDFHDLVVPNGQYFVMGDNRDNSEDSRYWGFVDRQYLVGKAFAIWMSWGNEDWWHVRFSRIGSLIK